MEFVTIIVLFLVVILVQNFIYSRFSFENFEYECYFDKDEAVEGDEIEFTEVVTNRKILPLPWLKSEIVTSKFLEFENTESQITDKSRFVPSFFMLKSYNKVIRKRKVLCLKRGEYFIDTVPIVSTDIFGNLSTSYAFDVNVKLMVLPKPIDNEDLSVSSKYFYGDIMVKRFILPDPFYKAGVRDYQAGDTMNKINWNATARQQKLMSYNNEFTSSQNVTVILNMQSHETQHNHVVYKDAIENGIKVCAAILDNTVSQGMPIKFMCNASLPGEKGYIETAENFGEEHLNNVLRILARLELKTEEKFPQYLSEINSKIASTDVVIVTCFIDDEMQKFASNKKLEGIHVKFLVLRYMPEDINYDCDIISLAESFEKEHKYE